MSSSNYIDPDNCALDAQGNLKNAEDILFYESETERHQLHGNVLCPITPQWATPTNPGHFQHFKLIVPMALLLHPQEVVLLHRLRELRADL